MDILDLFQGFIIGSSLIIAIGPQNIFVINQGLKNKYILLVVLICSFSDSFLIITGIYMSKILIGINTTIIFYIKIIGGIWLIFYGINKIIISLVKLLFARKFFFKNYIRNFSKCSFTTIFRTDIINMFLYHTICIISCC